MSTIHIVVTNQVALGKGLLYEFQGRRGRKRFVAIYRAFATNEGGKRFNFLVTRDSSTAIFDGLEDRYGTHGECPPGGPYTGFVRTDGSVGFRIEFFDPKQEGKVILSPSGVARTHIQIHFGAACSHGCILVAGRRRMYQKNFERPLKALGLKEDTIIMVTVEPR